MLSKAYQALINIILSYIYVNSSYFYDNNFISILLKNLHITLNSLYE